VKIAKKGVTSYMNGPLFEILYVCFGLFFLSLVVYNVWNDYFVFYVCFIFDVVIAVVFVDIFVVGDCVFVGHAVDMVFNLLLLLLFFSIFATAFDVLFNQF